MPKPLSSQCKEMVASLIKYFGAERDNNGPFFPLQAVQDRVAVALSISKRTVSRISSSVQSNVTLNSPKKKRCRRKKVTETSKLDTNAIRDVIYNMYEKVKENVTVRTLLTQLKDRELFLGSSTSLYRLLKEIGFNWAKDNPRRGLMELPNIAFKRTQRKSYLMYSL
ncbi:hypothetical protein ABEB36_000134 [Hypothenemus hampei]|uniref:Winged helix-turn helix domain-containing protein n=1 Tax=Hypothenemus hampei TaxID=57062 RepID=A0ABD1FB25_HYPHA